jgi:hypothetical protein
LDLGVLGHATLEGTLMTNYNGARRSKNELGRAYGHANITKALEDTVDDYTMLPDKATNAWVFGNGFIYAFFGFVSRLD